MIKKYKNTAIALSLCLATVACTSSSMAFDSHRKITKMSDKEISERGISVSEKIIYTKDTIPVARITSFEHECYKGDCIIEISITMNPDFASASTEIMRFVYTIHPNSKIEINFDGNF